MATWKKLIVSGSNISLLANDSGYATVPYVDNSVSTLSGSLSSRITLDEAALTTHISNYTADSASFENRITLIDTRVTNVEGDVSDLQNWSASLDSGFVSETELTAYSASVATRNTSIESDVATNASDISTNTSNISTNASDISTNTSNISTNASDISTNASNISSNHSTFLAASASIATDINTNASDISTVDTALTTFSSSAESRISTNETAIASLNGGNIAKYNAYTSSFTTEALTATTATVSDTLGVTGVATFDSDVTIQGDLSVAGTASFVNVEELIVKDKFITLNSGSSALTDAGFVFQANSNGTGPSLFLESTSTGTYGRMAMATSVASDATQATPAAYVTTTEVDTLPPSAAPTFGGSSNGFGNIHVDSATGDIWIYS